MNRAVAEALKNKLKGIAFLDLIGGLVAIQETTDVVEDQTTGQPRNVVHRAPVAKEVWFANESCQKVLGSLDVYDMSPDSAFAGIAYFEDQGTSIPTRQGAFLNFNSNIRLVCWLNTKQFTDDDNNANLSAKLVAAIIGRLTGNPFTAAPLSKVQVSVRNIPQTGKQLFTAYTLKEETSQYLMPPYEVFAIDFSVAFSISVSCQISTTIQNIPPC